MGDLGVELVDLLEGKTLGLVDHGPDEEDADEAEAAPDEEDLCAEVGVTGSGIDHVGSSAEDLLASAQRTVVRVWNLLSDGPVEKPVGGGGHGERLGAHLEREELTGDDPGDGTP